MDKENIIVDKSYQFGLRILKLYIFIRNAKVERELLIQLLKSGTSVGANIERLKEDNQVLTSSISWELLIKKQENRIIGFGF